MQAVIRPLVDHYLPKADPTWEEVAKQGSRSAYLDSIGKDWKVIWPFEIGQAGSAQFAPIAGPDIATDPATPAPPDFQVYQDTETWPGIQESTVPAFNQKEITLKRMKADVHIPMQIARIARLKPACVGDPMAGIMRGWAKRIAKLMTQAWYAQTGNSLVNSIGSFTAAGQTLSGTATDIVLDVAGTSNAVPNSFAKWSPGDSVDLYQYNSNTRLNSVPVFIGKVLGYNRTATYPGGISLYSPFANITLPSAVVHICLRGSGRESATSYLPTPLDSLFKTTTGTIFGINVALYPQFQSIVETTAMVPTEVNFTKYFAEQEMYHSDLDDDSLPDTCLMTPGVMSRFFQDAQASHLRIVDNGQALDMSGGVKSKITYTLFDREYTFRKCRWLPQKHTMFLKLKNNWEIVRPPRHPNSKSGPGFDQSLEFLAPVWGHPSIFLPAYQTGGGTAGAFTNMGHAPAEMIYEVLPKAFGGWFKFTNLTEAYIS